MIQIPLSFILENAKLNWPDWAWCYFNNCISWQEIVDIACSEVKQGNENETIFRLACVLEDTADEVPALLRKFVEEKELTENLPEKKWVYLTLAWLYHKREMYDDPLLKVEEVYANYNYPVEIESFVRYMPPTDGYDTAIHTQEENNSRLFSNWASYLNQKKEAFNT